MRHARMSTDDGGRRKREAREREQEREMKREKMCIPLKCRLKTE